MLHLHNVTLQLPNTTLYLPNIILQFIMLHYITLHYTHLANAFIESDIQFEEALRFQNNVGTRVLHFKFLRDPQPTKEPELTPALFKGGRISATAAKPHK